MSDSLIDGTDITPVLNDIMLAELAGVVRYTHYSLVITGPNRLPLVAFMQEQADESLVHARQAGEILTGLGGHPEQGIGEIEEYARTQIGSEELHVIEMNKLLRDYTIV